MEPTWICRVSRRVIIFTPVDSYPMTDDGSTVFDPEGQTRGSASSPPRGESRGRELAEVGYPITKTKGPISFGRRSSVIGGRRQSTFIEL